MRARDLIEIPLKNSGAPTEPAWERARLLAPPLFILLGFTVFTHVYWVPAHGGMDQNAYLVAGRMLAEHGSPRLVPSDPDSFVGRMWVLTPRGQYFPKYPLGLPLLVALLYKIAGPRGVYWISPLCTVFALWAIFWLARRFGGWVAAILCTLLLASSPLALALANNHASHAPDLCAVAWGMLCLLRWRERGGAWRAALAGLILGFAATIRYTEALLILPLLVIALWPPRRSLVQVGLLITCWATPVALLLIYNKSGMEVWTGYQFTGESAWGRSLSLAHLADNSGSIVRLLYFTGLGFALPAGALGLVVLTLRERRLGLFLWAWLIPSLLIAGTYYWVPGDVERLDAARFLLTALPPLAIGAGWCLGARWNSRALPGRWLLPILALLIVGVVTATWNLRAALPLLRLNQDWNAGIARAADELVHAHAPPGSVLLAPESYANHLQFASDYQLYSTDDFDPAYYTWLSRQTPPSPLQISRFAARLERLKSLGVKGRRDVLRTMVNAAFKGGRRVFAIVSESPADLPDRFAEGGFQIHSRSTWSDVQGAWHLIELKPPSQ